MAVIAPRIAADPNIHFGRPVIDGTRVPVDVIIGKLAGGMTVDEVAQDYRIERDDVLAALSYAARLLADDHIRAI
jgi:uncharacterized protein (DUF433 family)